jgi:hypothetical protein
MKTLPAFNRWIVSISAILVAVLALCSCLSKPPLHKQTFTFGAPSAASGGTVTGDRVLGIRHLRIAPPFDGRSLVYRTGEFSYVRDPYAEFLDPPEEEMMAPVRGWLRHNGCFTAVMERGSALRPNTILEISVPQFYGDFRIPEHPTAILTMQFTFFEASNGVPEKLIWQHEYSRIIPLKTSTAALLMEGWNKGLSEILGDASSDFHRTAAADR